MSWPWGYRRGRDPQAEPLRSPVSCSLLSHPWRAVYGGFVVVACSDACCCLQVNGVALQDAEHHQAVEALRGAGATVHMRLWRERMVEPENAVTVTPLRPEDDYSPRERRLGGLRLPLPETPGPLRQRHVACLVRSEKGLGFSIAGGKGSTPYRAGDGVSGQGQPVVTPSRATVPLTSLPLSPQGIFISRIAEGGAAHRAGTLQVGDRVLSVSGGHGTCQLPRLQSPAEPLTGRTLAD